MHLLRLPAVTECLERFGVVCRWRTGMTLDLRRLSGCPSLPAGYELRPWDPAYLRDVAELDYRAYYGTMDARLYWQYFSTPTGCERMWREALAGKFGCFDPLRTLLLFHQGRLCGDVMTSARSHVEGFIGNLAVAPEHRGGTGSAMLIRSLWGFREAGFERVSLAVTLENQHAYQLYDRIGFMKSGEFPVVARPPAETMTWQAAPPGIEARIGPGRK